MDRQIQELRDAVRQDPNDPENWLELGIALRESGDAEEAILALSKAHELAPEHDLTALNLALALGDVDRHQEAIRVADGILGRKDSADARYLKAWSLNQLGQSQEALEIFLRGIQSEGDARSHSGAASAYARLGRYRESLNAYEHALELDPDFNEDAQFLYGLALAQSALGQRSVAIETLTRAYAMAPQNRSIGNELGKLLGLSGQYTKAIEVLTEVSENFPDDYFPLNNLAHAYLYAGMPRKSLPYFDRTIELAPDYPNSRFGRGDALMQVKDYGSAIDDFLQATRIMPEVVYGWKSLVQCYLELGKVNEAKSALGEALQLHPDARDLLDMQQIL